MTDNGNFMTPTQAFSVLFIFLEEYWKRGGRSSNDIAVLLGSLQRVGDGLPLDQALWNDWLNAWNEVRKR